MNIEQPNIQVLSLEEEEAILKIHDLLEEGRPKKAAKSLLEMKNRMWKSITDYVPLISFMRKLKEEGCELTFSYLHTCGDKTAVRFAKDLRKAQTEEEIECLFMTLEGGRDCPRSQEVRIRNTDLFTHYLEALYLALLEKRELVA